MLLKSCQLTNLLLPGDLVSLVELNLERNLFIHLSLPAGLRGVGSLDLGSNNLEDAGFLANLSEAAFSRFFKLRAGKTLPRFINELRVGRACRLLVEEEMKIVDVALNCGFSNLTNFNRRFLEIAGQVPSDYRRQFRRVKI